MSSTKVTARLRRATAGPCAAVLATACGLALMPASALAAVKPTNTTLPAITGTSVQGSALTTSKGTWANSPTSYTYNWLRCDSAGRTCVKIAAATAQTYTLVSGDVGHTIRSAVHASNAAGTGNARSAATAVVKATATTRPANTGRPVVTGTTQTGQTLTSSSGSWSGSTPMTYGYQWQRCDSAGAGCVAITGATTRTYALTSADEGHALVSSVSASNSAGSAAATSNPTAAVAPAPAPSPAPSPAPAPAPTPGAGLHVSGNKLLDASGAVVQLHGVNYSGTEYACIQGWGIFDGPSDDAMVTAIRAWNSNVVHIGLNEDCILGINGVNPAYAGANYMNPIVAFVNRLHAHGMFAEVSLMWAAPGTQQALDHPAILDADHAPAALTAIGNAFKGDPNTFIGLQSEPHNITYPCWRDGGSACSVGYTALGMQGALNAVRATGAKNPVTASGIDYANNLSQWLTYRPSDPAGQFMAEAHVYGQNGCSSTACFDRDYAPVAASVPLVFGETGETFDASSCASTNTATFMSWADAHGVGYEAWQWDPWGNCLDLIADYSGTPANSSYAKYVQAHYASRP